MSLRKNEHIINHCGEYYKGTIGDYISICTGRFNPNCPLPKATGSEIEEYARRRKQNERK